MRDPTKEILNGLYNRDPGGAPGGGRRRRPPPPRFQSYFGRVRTHQKPDNKQSQFQLLRKELFNGGAGKAGKPDHVVTDGPSYGTVHRFSPAAAATEKSSSLDLVRSILAKEEGPQVNEESKNAFDRIREKLLNTRTRNHRVRQTSRERNLRRKGSKKRRRNVSRM